MKARIHAPIAMFVALVLFIVLSAIASITTIAQSPRGDRLVANSVHTRNLTNGAVTTTKLALVSVTINVSATATTGSSAANPALVGGTIIGYRQAGNQDQHIDNMVLNGDGSITITLAAAATAQNNFVVLAVKSLGT